MCHIGMCHIVCSMRMWSKHLPYFWYKHLARFQNLLLCVWSTSAHQMLHMLTCMQALAVTLHLGWYKCSDA